MHISENILKKILENQIDISNDVKQQDISLNIIQVFLIAIICQIYKQRCGVKIGRRSIIKPQTH